MKPFIKNTILVLTAALLLPLALVRVVTKNVVEEVKAFSEGFISQQAFAQVQVEDKITIAQPKEVTVPVEEVKPEQVYTVKVVVKQAVVKPVTEVVTDIDYMKKRICEVFGDQCNNALIIAQKESHFNTRAISKTNDYGVFQLNCRWQGRRVGGDCNKFLDFETNLRIAKQIYNEQGWNPWSTKIFLPK
jgi:hypothetical protein